jgi:LemA protein
MSGWLITGVIIILALWGVALYNSLVTLRQRNRQAFADIDVQLRQRHDLVPNLVETVKGYARH